MLQSKRNLVLSLSDIRIIAYSSWKIHQQHHQHQHYSSIKALDSTSFFSRFFSIRLVGGLLFPISTNQFSSTPSFQSSYRLFSLLLPTGPLAITSPYIVVTSSFFLSCPAWFVYFDICYNVSQFFYTHFINLVISISHYLA